MAFNPNILNPDVQDFIREEKNRRPSDIALSKSKFDQVSAAELAEQVDARQRCKQKLPTWYEKKGIYYPKKVSIEQSSSEIAARFKANICPNVSSVADLTGGMGVDIFHLCSGKEKAIHCEIMEDLSKISQYNAQVFGIKNLQFHHGDGLHWLQQQAPDSWELTYLDPARRVGDKRLYGLQDCYPNVLEFIDLLLEKSPYILIKAAPMVDITDSEIALRGYVKEVHVVSIQQECKEILFLLERSTSVIHSNPRIATMFINGQSKSLSLTLEDEKEANISYVQNIENYLFEPDVALMKAGAFKTVAKHFNIKKIHPHTHLYTSSEKANDFMGKTIKVQHVTPYSIFKKRKQFEGGATVVTKNFPSKVEELRKKHKIGENPEVYLYFLTDFQGQLIVVEGTIIR